MRRALVLGLLAALIVVFAGAARSARADATGPAIKPFVVYGVYTREQRSLLVSMGYDIGEAAWPDHVELFATQADADALAIRGYRVAPQVRTDDFPPADSKYHNYKEMVRYVKAIAAAHPSTVHLFSLGESYEGRDLIGARVSDDATDNLSEPGVFYVGQHHAREHLTVEVVLSLLKMFAESANPAVQQLVQTRQIYIVPSLNPDGAEFDLTNDSYHYWRKNRQPTNLPNVYGTDQNRNYDYKWGCCGGSSSDPHSEVYRGPSPFSTPEDSRLAEFVVAHPNITTGISYHSYADLILYPYGYTYDDIPSDMRRIDHKAFVKIGAEMSRTTGYTAQQSSDLYITDGDWNDWMYGAQHRYPFTIELSGNGFYPPDEFIKGEAKRNHAAALYVATIADCPTAVVGRNCG